MKPSSETLNELAAGLARAEEKLQMLEYEIREVGEPAGAELRKRLDALRIEESALKRNIEDAFGAGCTDDSRIAKIEALLEHIENEELHIQHEAAFLEQAVPNTSEVLAKAGDKVIRLVLGAIKRVVGDHHPMGMSVFVNHTHQNLAQRYGIDAVDDVPGERGRS